MTTRESRPDLEMIGAAESGLAATAQNTPIGYKESADTRPRCRRCAHSLTAHRSVARAYGPKCWTRTEVGQLERRRDEIGRQLNGLARQVASLDPDALESVGAALDLAGGR